MTRAIVLDTETIDKNDSTAGPNEVIELAWTELGKVGFFEQRYKPTRPPTWGAVATHGICMVDLEGLPPSHEAPRCVPQVDYWIGHNIDFDWKALGQPPVKRICTLALSRALWPEVDSHTLTAMTYFTKGATPATRELVRNAHSAAHDVALCVDLLAVIQAILKCDDLETLYEHSEDARIPKVMTFGKFKGEPISKVDRGYANWYRKQTDTDPYVLEAFKRAGLI